MIKNKHRQTDLHPGKEKMKRVHAYLFFFLQDNYDRGISFLLKDNEVDLIGNFEMFKDLLVQGAAGTDPPRSPTALQSIPVLTLETGRKGGAGGLGRQKTGKGLAELMAVHGPGSSGVPEGMGSKLGQGAEQPGNGALSKMFCAQMEGWIKRNKYNRKIVQEFNPRWLEGLHPRHYAYFKDLLHQQLKPETQQAILGKIGKALGGLTELQLTLTLYSQSMPHALWKNRLGVLEAKRALTSKEIYMALQETLLTGKEDVIPKIFSLYQKWKDMAGRHEMMALLDKAKLESILPNNYAIQISTTIHKTLEGVSFGGYSQKERAAGKLLVLALNSRAPEAAPGIFWMAEQIWRDFPRLLKLELRHPAPAGLGLASMQGGAGKNGWVGEKGEEQPGKQPGAASSLNLWPLSVLEAWTLPGYTEHKIKIWKMLMEKLETPDTQKHHYLQISRDADWALLMAALEFYPGINKENLFELLLRQRHWRESDGFRVFIEKTRLQALVRSRPEEASASDIKKL